MKQLILNKASTKNRAFTAQIFPTADINGISQRFLWPPDKYHKLASLKRKCQKCEIFIGVSSKASLNV
jgi:hypothetical protein